MELISFAIFVVLQLVSLVHFGWAFGMAWPAKHRAALPMMVVGLPEGSPMPSVAVTVLVAIAISGLGLVALWGAGMVNIFAFEGLKGWVLICVAAIFGIRGVMTYLPFGPLKAAVQPFRSLDLRYFGPLCLMLATGYFVIFLSL
ncbi:MAG: DUF3995 domain-containing protein [Rhodobacteraceae bacterium]|nr:DUF3995 domain-containing protein [Paracoccaceae bacterium]